MLRNRQALIPYLLLVAALAGGVLWHESEQVPGLGRVVTTGQADVGGPFQLTDQHGKRVSDADFRGRYMLIYFGYSFCPDVCPTTLQEMSDAFAKLGSKKSRVVPVFITVDPARDTPHVLKDYLKSFGPEFLGLTGDEKQIAEAARVYRVFIRKHPLPGGNYSMDHSGVIYLMGPDGRFVTYYEDEIGPDRMADDLSKRL